MWTVFIIGCFAALVFVSLGPCMRLARVANKPLITALSPTEMVKITGLRVSVMLVMAVFPVVGLFVSALIDNNETTEIVIISLSGIPTVAMLYVTFSTLGKQEA